jgi:hypothetical protein
MHNGTIEEEIIQHPRYDDDRSGNEDTVAGDPRDPDQQKQNTNPGNRGQQASANINAQ